MVAIKYTAQNYMMFGKTKIVNGINEIPDETFYKLMDEPLFRSRVSSGIIKVPIGFPLLKPAKKPKSNEEKRIENHKIQEKHAEKKHSEEVPTQDKHHESKHAEEKHVEKNDSKKGHAEHLETPEEYTHIKELLKNIHTSKDCDFLVDLASNHGKEKVREAAKLRLEQLNVEDYKKKHNK